MKIYINKFLSSILFIFILAHPSFCFAENNNFDSKVLDVPYLNQQDIISGCEAVSATMLLNYFGYKIDKHEFIKDYLIKKDWEKIDNQIYACDPNSAYVGDPYIASGNNCGFGCYSPCIAKSMNKFLNGKEHIATSIKGESLENLIKNYIIKDLPILIWATMDMKPSKLTQKWQINYKDENSELEIGDDYQWLAGEHCLVLVGFDENNYYFNDPYKNHGLIMYEKKLVNKRFNELGQQAVCILNIPNIIA